MATTKRNLISDLKAHEMPELQAQGLECVRGNRLLFRGLDFHLNGGDLIQIEGANGCGKTSLLRILAGLSPPHGGEVRWRGRNIQKQRAHYCSELAYLGHHAGVKAELTALENLHIAALLRNSRPPADPYGILERIGLYGYEDVPVSTLSAGQRQRIALARLLIHPVSLWILDEPFTSLDAHGVALAQELLEEQIGTGGMVVLTSHQPLRIQGQIRKLRLTAR